MSEPLKCVFCGGPVEYVYEGSSDHIFECQESVNLCGASVRFWINARVVGAGQPEVAEARRRYECRAAPAGGSK